MRAQRYPHVTRREVLLGLAVLGAVSSARSYGDARVPACVPARDPFVQLDAIAQAQLVARGEVTALELVDAAIRRIEALEPTLNALAGFDFERARTIAKTVNRTAPFAGVPFLIKDLLAYPGLRHSFGSRLFANQIAHEGSEYTQHFDRAGLVTIGKTSTSEYGLLGATETLLEGVTRNPWDLGKSPAGSSGGSASAVASGMVPIAHATDGGGSIRIPASVCGLFGFKPSRGRTVTDGRDIEVVINHCVSRSVRDSALLLDCTERKGASAQLPEIGFVREPMRERLKIACYSQTLMGADPHPTVREALESSMKLCADLGHTVVLTDRPQLDGQAIGEAFFILAAAGLAQMAQAMGAALGKPVDGTLLEPFTLQLIEWYRRKPASAVEQARSVLKQAEQQLAEYLSRCDVALCPTLAIPPFEIGHLPKDASFDRILDLTKGFAGYTPVHNQAGVPAMSVPLFWSKEGMPIGTHFAAAKGQDARLLQLAYQLEQARPWGNRWPPISAGASLPAKS